MRASAKLLCLLIAGFFWVAQVQSAVHGISHLHPAAELQAKVAPHSVVCAQCAAYSQSGAAPLADLKPPPFVWAPAGAISDSGASLIERAPAIGFRSRAPPSASN